MSERGADPRAAEAGWLHPVNTRRAQREDRRSVRRERRVAAGVLGLVLALLGALLVWAPWDSASSADSGNTELGADRVAVLLQIQDDAGDATGAVLLRDRRRCCGALVVIPPALALPVPGTAGSSAASALREAGPTSAREALADLLGVPLAGSWVLSGAEFAGLVDRLGGIRVGAAVLPGAQAATRAHAGGAQEVFAAVLGAFPGRFSAGDQLLGDLGVLDSPGLPTTRLAAVLVGLAREAAAGELRTATLPAAGGRLAPEAARIVRDLLGGDPSAPRPGATPRIAVSISAGASFVEPEVRADVLDAGYEYLLGPVVGRDAGFAVMVRPGTVDAQRLGADVAALFGLPVRLVRVGPGVPLGADVAVVLGRGRLPR